MYIRKKYRQLVSNYRNYKHLNGDFLFIHIGKTAGTSIEKILRISPIHYTAIESKAIIGEESWERKFTFCFVRNPYDRIVSLYEYIAQKKNRFGGNYISFSQFIQDVLVDKAALIGGQEREFMPQINWISDHKGEIIVDFIGRFESLQDDFKTICDKLGKDLHLPHLNPTKRKNYKSYYDSYTKEVISNYYSKDIEIFNYQF